VSAGASAIWLEGARAPLLEARDLTVSYRLPRGPLGRGPARLRALEDLWLHVEPAECLALVGESGSGKTTAARALLRLVEPDAGEVWWRARVCARCARSWGSCSRTRSPA
jgi:ABC-type glutathione transport system ATPase component